MIDHQPCINEMARLQRERDELARYAERLREQGLVALGLLSVSAPVSPQLIEGLRSALAGEIEPQDPALDALEDEAYAQAVASATARMSDAEAREDRAESLTAADAFHLDACPHCPKPKDWAE